MLRECVLLAENVSYRSPQPGVLRHQVCPAGGVLLEVLNGRAEWWFPPECKRLEEREIAFIVSLLGEESLHGPPRLRNESGSASFDEEQQNLGAPGGHAAEDLFAREQVVG